jgi:hypothetical protein
MKAKRSSLPKLMVVSFASLFAAGLVSCQQDSGAEWSQAETNASPDYYVILRSKGYKVGSPESHVAEQAERILWQPFTTHVTKSRVVATVEREYLCRVRLLGEDGKEVVRTPLGKTYGARFDDLTTSPRLRLISLDALPESEKGQLALISSLAVHSPNELFRITEPGLYTLEMQFQFLVPTNPATPGFALVRTPVARMKVRQQ